MVEPRNIGWECKGYPITLKIVYVPLRGWVSEPIICNVDNGCRAHLSECVFVVSPSVCFPIRVIVKAPLHVNALSIRLIGSPKCQVVVAITPARLLPSPFRSPFILTLLFTLLLSLPASYSPLSLPFSSRVLLYCCIRNSHQPCLFTCLIHNFHQLLLFSSNSSSNSNQIVYIANMSNISCS